nr:hypothetical protein [Tanacetum cinerariifolium]
MYIGEAVSIFDNGLRRAIEAIVVDSDYGYALDRVRMSLPDFDLSGFSNKDTAPPEPRMFWRVPKSLGASFDLSPRQKAVVECLRAPHAQNFLTVIPIETGPTYVGSRVPDYP